MIPSASKTSVAYFSMEIALDKAIPTYSGGLGVLAGDTLRSAADLAVPVVGVTLLHRKGYFDQHIDTQGNQTEKPSEWRPEDILEPVDVRATVIERVRGAVHDGHQRQVTRAEGAPPQAQQVFHGFLRSARPPRRQSVAVEQVFRLLR